MEEEKVTASLMKDKAKVHADGVEKKAPKSTKDEEEGARTNGDDAATVGLAGNVAVLDVVRIWF